ncbi:FAD dependent oxidoreductase [Guyanagaster necrorhizus]|uniref:FAD dependent oxidoreductase n=1 Tax=Guyanagaster necrorhizus TaxID=856835 RepID=A0A9P8AX76_9AGAR|nr:FAD dependent oxidoreductase [Guyanagaster necrorhizus MCA 3950]KAG7449647.1 FAD dependent oxidoreductase [Guyanagaster necrorhizus MCA 3950]
MAQVNDSVLIIGAGVFGISTAYHLLIRGFTDVTVIERGESLPPADGTSNDFNRIVRTSYNDPFYANLAHDAIQSWKNQELFGDSYQESGVLVLGSATSYVHQSYEGDVALGLRLKTLENADAIRGIFPDGVKVGSFDKVTGYLNLDGGWAHAAKGVSALTAKVIQLGGKVLPGKTVSELLKENDRTVGVQCKDGSSFRAKYIVIATGAWTPSAFPELNLQDKFVATGQSVTMVQLTPEEAKTYRDIPVVLDFDSGFYCFPPSADNIVKMAIHSRGYTHTKDAISTPRTVVSDGEDGLRIPKADLNELRVRFREVFPELADKSLLRTRLCWYTDTQDGDWVIGSHPTDSALIFATAGNGHAYKFLPVIGRLVADALEGKTEPTAGKKFAFDREADHSDHSRAGTERQELDLDQLCTSEDLARRV